MSLLERFPNASKTFLEINGLLPTAKSERDKKKSLGKTVPGKKKSMGRPTVSFHGFSVRPQDSDNFTGGCKDLLDGLWRCGAIDGDAPWQIETRYVQDKVKSFDEERVEIEIVYPC